MPKTSCSWIENVVIPEVWAQCSCPEMRSLCSFSLAHTHHVSRTKPRRIKNHKRHTVAELRPDSTHRFTEIPVEVFLFVFNTFKHQAIHFYLLLPKPQSFLMRFHIFRFLSCLQNALSWTQSSLHAHTQNFFLFEGKPITFTLPPGNTQTQNHLSHDTVTSSSTSWLTSKKNHLLHRNWMHFGSVSLLKKPPCNH